MIHESHISWPGWETVRLIGRGSFGAVYEIQRQIPGEVERAALKVISIPQHPGEIEALYNSGYDEESLTSTFQSHLDGIVAEYSLMRKLRDCPNVVSCDDIRYIQHDDGIGWDIFIKMELLTPLAKSLPPQITDETVVKLAKDICCALISCGQKNVIHRDIKPENIFVSDSGIYKLGDFGIAKAVEQTMGGTIIGTFRYMAPEVYHNHPYGAAADIYSLGLVLYWMLNERRLPFLPLPPAKLSAGLEDISKKRRFQGEQLPPPAHGSDKLKKIVLKACAYDPKDRYHSAEEMLADLNSSFIDEATRRRQEQEERERIAREQSQRAEQERIAREQAARAEQERLAREQARQEQLRREEQYRKQPEDQHKEHKHRVIKINTSLLCIIAGIFVVYLVFILAGGFQQKATDPSPSVNITFDISASEISFSRVGATFEITATDADVIWSTNATDIVSVSDTGVVTALNSGTAEVYAQCNGVVKTCVVHVDTYCPTEEEISEAKRQLSILEDYEARYTTYSYAEVQALYDAYLSAGNTIKTHSETLVKDLGNAKLYYYYADWYYDLEVFYFDDAGKQIYKDSYFVVIDGSFHTNRPPYSRLVTGEMYDEIFTVQTDKARYNCFHNTRSSTRISWEFYGADYVDGIASRTIIINND